MTLLVMPLIELQRIVKLRNQQENMKSG